MDCAWGWVPAIGAATKLAGRLTFGHVLDLFAMDVFVPTSDASMSPACGMAAGCGAATKLGRFII